MPTMGYGVEKQAVSPIDRNVNWQSLFGRGIGKLYYNLEHADPLI